MPLFGPPDVQKLARKYDGDGLLKALTYKRDSDVRARAAISLGNITLSRQHTERAIDLLIRQLARDQAHQVRQAAAQALGKIGDDRAIDALKAALNDEHELVRLSAVEALGGRLLNWRAVAPLGAALNDTAASVRAKAAYLIGECCKRAHAPGPYRQEDMRVDSAVQPLISALEDSDEEVKTQVWKALDALQEYCVKVMTLPGNCAKLLFSALKDADESARAGAGAALELYFRPGMRVRSAVAPLTTALQDDSHYVRMVATDLLGRINDPQAIDAVITALEDDHPDVRTVAVEVLGRIEDKRALGPLSEALQDGDEAVRVAATQVLERYSMHNLRSKRALQALVTALVDDSEAVRIATAEALQHYCQHGIRRESEAAPLIAAFNSDDADLREAIVDVLAEGEAGKWSIPLLLNALEDEHQEVRKSAVWGLSHHRDKRVVGPLIDALLDDDKSVRGTAAYALGNINDRQAVDPLVTALKDKEWNVRREAARALGKIKDSQAIDPLVAALQDANAKVSEAAREALEKIGVVEAPEAKFDLGALVEELCEILEREWGKAAASEASKQRAIEIGRQIDGQGGFEMMQDAMRLIAQWREDGSQELISAWWSGIGDWRW